MWASVLLIETNIGALKRSKHPTHTRACLRETVHVVHAFQAGRQCKRSPQAQECSNKLPTSFGLHTDRGGNLRAA